MNDHPHKPFAERRRAARDCFGRWAKASHASWTAFSTKATSIGWAGEVQGEPGARGGGAGRRHRRLFEGRTAGPPDSGICCCLCVPNQQGRTEAWGTLSGAGKVCCRSPGATTEAATGEVEFNGTSRVPT